MHTSATNRLNNVKDSLPFDKHIKYRRELPDILGKCAIEQQVTAETKHLGQHYSYYLGARSNFDTRHFLNRHDIREVIHHSSQVIYAIRVRNKGMPRLTLGHFFGAPVVITDIWHRINNDFPIKLQGDTKCTVHARVVRPQIEEHKLASLRLLFHPPFFWFKFQCFLLDRCLIVIQRKWLHLCCACWMFFPQSMALPSRRKYDSA